MPILDGTLLDTDPAGCEFLRTILQRFPTRFRSSDAYLLSRTSGPPALTRAYGRMLAIGDVQDQRCSGADQHPVNADCRGDGCRDDPEVSDRVAPTEQS